MKKTQKEEDSSCIESDTRGRGGCVAFSDIFWQLEWQGDKVFIGGSKGGRQGRAPPWGSKFFQFHAVFGRKMAK